MKTGYCININLVFKKESLQVWPWWLIDTITEALDKGECSIGVFLDFSKALVQFTMVYHYKNWNYMVYKISHSNYLKIIYQIEFSM